MAIKIFLRPFPFVWANARVRNDGDIVAAPMLASATPPLFRKNLLFIITSDGGWLAAPGGWFRSSTSHQPQSANHLCSLPLKLGRSQNQSDDLRHIHLAAGHSQAPLAQALVNRITRLRRNLPAQ